MRLRTGRLGCALALALVAPGQVGAAESAVDTWAGVQAKLSRVLSFIGPAPVEVAPTPPVTLNLTRSDGKPANEYAVVDQLAAGAALSSRPPAAVLCSQGLPEGPLDLAAVASQALCNHPKTRAAWAQARAEAARVEIARAAWQPTVQANASLTDASYDYSEPIERTLTADTLNLELRLSWLFYDFGRRRAGFDSAVAVLDAANATQDATVQQVLLEASQSWFDVRAAQAQVIAARDAEANARTSLDTAEARFNAGAVARLDVLQAGNALAQARLKRVQAESGLQNALGALAVRMGLSADAPVGLVPGEGSPSRWEPPGSAESLIAEARLYHPSLRAARSQLGVSTAQIDIARAEGLPTVGGNVRYLRNRELESTPLASFDTQTSFGLQLTIPLFEGQGRQGKINAAKAEFEARQSEIEDLEQQVSLEVWKAYNDLKSERERLVVGDELLVNARRAQEIAQGRYKAGVGDILEAINAQNVLAQTVQQVIEARSAWQTARLKLAAAMGRIGPWAIE